MEVETSGSIGVPSVLTIVFMILKLCGVITWSWWWVMSPLWITATLALLTVLVVLLLIRKK